MRVIENNDIIRVICTNCKSILAVGAEDIRWNEIVHHCSEFEITCCLCGSINGIDSKIIPRRWYNTIGVTD
jgi:RNase P subunit RPR2